MAFITDKQTLEDLGIFGKPGADSVYALFNRTCTAGGASLLEELFQHPLSDAGAIGERSRIIRQFAEQEVHFPFNPENFGLAEHYLLNTDERTKLSQGTGTVGKKLMHLMGTDTDYQLFQKGVAALKDILTTLAHFMSSGLLENLTIQGKEAVADAMKDEAIRVIIQRRKGNLAFAEVAEYDAVLRFKKRALVKQVLQFIYYLDVYIAVSHVAVERKLCFPNVLLLNQPVLRIQEVYHPLVNKAVANTLETTPEQGVVFLTGANMAGKSTLMKTLGIAVFLAHMGFPVAAASMEFAVMDGLFTTINLSDNLGSGTSHFYAEVLRIKKIAKQLGVSKRLFVIFDELFRGTNVKDAYEATIELVSAFAQKTNSIFVVSTHIIEAGDVLRERCTNIQFLYLPTLMQGNVPVYTYRLEQGITADRHGMIIIQNEGILDILDAPVKIPEHELYNG